MPQTCSVCRHVQRQEIEEALLAGEPLRNIAKRSGTSPATLLRHRPHIAAAVVRAIEETDRDRAADLLGKARDLEREAKRLGEKAEREGDVRAALLAVREVGRLLELTARLLGLFQREAPGGTHITVYEVLYSPQVSQGPQRGPERPALPAGEGGPITPP